jgi:hypothetical protein
MLFIQSYIGVNKNVQYMMLLIANGGCRGRDRMVVGFRTTYAISAYHH